MASQGYKTSVEFPIMRIVPPHEGEIEGQNVQPLEVSGDKTLIVGIGGSGSQLLKRVYEQHSESQDIYYLAVNSDYTEMELLDDNIPKLHLKRIVGKVVESEVEGQHEYRSMLNGQGAGGHPEEGQRMMRENINDFLSLYRQFESEMKGGAKFCRVILLYGYGGGTGAGASLVIAETLKETHKNLEIHCIVVTPLMAGSDERMAEIVATVRKMEKLVKVFFPIDQEGMRRAFGDLSQSEASVKLYDVALQAVNAFLLVIGVPIEKNIDAADLASALGVKDTSDNVYGRCAIAGYAEGKSGEIPEIDNYSTNNELLRLLYMAVPGAFMFLRDLEGARHCIVKLVYGKGVAPTPKDIEELATALQVLVHGKAGKFTISIGYGQSDEVEENSYKFAVFFSQFEGKNAKTLAGRFEDEYEKWKKYADAKLEQRSINVPRINTYRDDDDLAAQGDDIVEGKEERVEKLEEESGKQAAKFSLSEIAKNRVGYVPSVEERVEVKRGSGNVSMAAAKMTTDTVSTTPGRPKQLNIYGNLGPEQRKEVLQADQPKVGEAQQSIDGENTPLSKLRVDPNELINRSLE